MISYAGITSEGGRAVNEDSIGTLEQNGGYFFALADGLGGHGRGDAASQAVVKEAVRAYAESSDFTACFQRAQDALLREQEALNAKDEMKTTLVCLEIKDGKAIWGHVGDSRLYLFDRSKLSKQTLDHSVPQMLVAIGEIESKGIRRHEDRNRLLRVLGIPWDRPKYEIADEIELGGDRTFLLCSDGFWEWIVERDMEKTLKNADTPDAWLKVMETRILKNGRGAKMDNYSAIAVFARK